MEETSSSSAAIEPMHGVVVTAENENERQRTVFCLLTIHELEQIPAPCGASRGNLCGSTSELQPVFVTVEHQERIFGVKTRVELDPAKMEQGCCA